MTYKNHAFVNIRLCVVIWGFIFTLLALPRLRQGFVQSSNHTAFLWHILIPRHSSQMRSLLPIYFFIFSGRSVVLAYVYTSRSGYNLGNLFSWASSPFWNMKGPGELKRSAMERMNRSRTIIHISLDAFHTRACNNNSLTVAMAFCDVFCLKGILIETGESSDFTHKKLSSNSI